jgi:hypothetical protein
MHNGSSISSPQRGEEGGGDGSVGGPDQQTSWHCRLEAGTRRGVRGTVITGIFD